MPTERTNNTRQQQVKESSPPEEGYYGKEGIDPADPSGAANGGHRAGDISGRGGERSGSSGLKAKLAAKLTKRRTDDSEKKVRVFLPELSSMLAEARSHSLA